MPIIVAAAKEVVRPVKMEDSLADLDRIVERRMQRMGGLLVVCQELEVRIIHRSAIVPQDLVDTVKVRIILGSGLNYLGLNFVPFCLAALGLAPFKDLGKHTVYILRDWIVREYIGVEGAHVHTPGKGHVAVLLSNAAAR